VAKVTVAKALANVVRPLFEFGGVDLDRGATTAAREVVVVRVNDATSIETLAAVGHDDVDLAVLDQLFQLRVDRRERDSPAVSFDERMEFLGAHEALQLTEDANHLSSLHRISGRGHDFIVVVASLLSRTILINVVGIILERVR
jgi:hypothetical protein